MCVITPFPGPDYVTEPTPAASTSACHYAAKNGAARSSSSNRVPVTIAGRRALLPDMPDTSASAHSQMAGSLLVGHVRFRLMRTTTTYLFEPDEWQWTLALIPIPSCLRHDPFHSSRSIRCAARRQNHQPAPIPGLTKVTVGSRRKTLRAKFTELGSKAGCHTYKSTAPAILLNEVYMAISASLGFTTICWKIYRQWERRKRRATGNDS